MNYCCSNIGVMSWKSQSYSARQKSARGTVILVVENGIPIVANHNPPMNQVVESTLTNPVTH